MSDAKPTTLDKLAETAWSKRAHLKYDPLPLDELTKIEFFEGARVGWHARDPEVAALVTALEFYANPENYIKRDQESWRSCAPEPLEMIRDYRHPRVDWRGTVEVGGTRAREALKRHRGEKNETK